MQQFEKELTHYLYSNLKVSLVGFLLNIVILFFIFLHYTPYKLPLLIWLLLMVGIILVRLYTHYLYEKNHHRYSVQTWKRLFFILLTISTLIWALAPLFALSINSIVPIALLAAIYAGVAAGGMLSLSANFKAAMLFLTIPLTTFILALFLKKNLYTTELALLFIFYLFFMIISAKRLHQQFLQILVLNRKYLLEKNIAEQAQKRLKAVFESSPIGIFFFDQNKKILDANRRFYEIFGKRGSFEKELQPYLETKRSGEHFLELGNSHLKIQTSPILEGQNSQGAVGIVSDLTKEKALLDKTKYQATYDHLTRIPNRSSLFENISAHLNNLKEHRIRFAVLFIDLDNFKNINDSLGHQIGDIILVEISHRLKNSIRKSDFIARLGGDEFVVVLADLPDEEIKRQKIIERITKKLHNEVSKPISINSLTLRLTSSIGVVFVEDHDIDPYDIIKFADIAMYQAKKEGKNKTRFYQKEMDRWIKRRLELENALKEAIKKNELHLVYQPISSITDGRPVGVEVLLRWHNERFRDVPIQECIHIAEENGSIIEIGEWILRHSLSDFKRIHAKFPFVQKLAINISIKQFNEPGFIPLLTDIADRYAIEYGMIELELTESIFINDKENAKIIMQDLRDLGFSLSIDDFGTGYSSLSYLKFLPFTTLKIDRSFIQDITKNEEDAALVDTIVSIAKKFSLKTVAEGVEKKEQLELLKKYGTDYYQGFFKSKPLPLQEIKKFLQKV